MEKRGEVAPGAFRPRCCMGSGGWVSRRGFLEAAGGAALLGLSYSLVKAAEAEAAAGAPAPPRAPLVVKPILTYETPTRRKQTSWRSWGGIETQAQATEEVARIQGELDKLRASADFPLAILPVAAVRGGGEVAKLDDLAQADAFIIYAAGGGALDAVVKQGKPCIFFLRHKSGPVYLWYEIISPRYLRAHTDRLAQKTVDDTDVVVDVPDEMLWRLRALCGLKNTIGARIVTIGGASGWAQGKAPDFYRERFKLDIQDVPYKELAELIKAARADAAAVKLAKERAAAYLKGDGVKLETSPEFVENCFLLDHVFRGIMAKFQTRHITINHCMGTIMPIAETTACLTLSTLNDAGFNAFCESDFVVVPSGMLLNGISGLPTFLNDPTYPHHQVITLAHCTGPRRCGGKALDPVRLVTHFESDYGAAPKVEMPKGQKVTCIIPDFEARCWVGLAAEIVDAPFLPICRCQIDVQFKPDAQLVAQRMPGFHWMTGYGDYRRELGYALRRTPIKWEDLG